MSLYVHACGFRDALRPSILDAAPHFARFWRMLRTFVEDETGRYSAIQVRGIVNSHDGHIHLADATDLTLLAVEAAIRWIEGRTVAPDVDATERYSRFLEKWWTQDAVGFHAMWAREGRP